MDESVLACLPQRIQDPMRRAARKHVRIEEIRIRIGWPVEVISHSQSSFLTERGMLTLDWQQGMRATPGDGHKMMNLLSRHSVYAIEEELKRGFITVKGGHRVGLVGRAVTERGEVKFLKNVSGFNFRIAREIKGAARELLPLLLEKGKFLSTLIVSPPQCGKTTLLRDIVRILSYGRPAWKLPGTKVGLVDERSEIASCMDGVPQNDLGPRVDVLDACPKAQGMMMLIRSMSPEVLAADEIGSEQDAQAVLEAIHAGVAILTTAHGHGLHDVHKRPNLRSLFEQQAFERYVILSRSRGAGTIEKLFDGQGRQMKSFARHEVG